MDVEKDDVMRELLHGACKKEVDMGQVNGFKTKEQEGKVLWVIFETPGAKKEGVRWRRVIKRQMGELGWLRVG